MAALQQSPVALRAQFAPENRVRAAPKPLLCSFLGKFPSLKLAARSNARSVRRRRGGATMMDSAAASYASALADVAKSNKTLEATCADIEKVEKLFSVAEISSFFMNPTIGIEKKREMIDEITRSSALQPHTANFLNILIDMRRTELVLDIVKEFEIFYNKITNTEMVTVTSVVKLEPQHLAQIAQSVQRLTGAKNVRIKTVIDPSLVAGFTIRYGSSGSKLIDMSVKKQLDEIASELDFSSIVGSLAE